MLGCHILVRHLTVGGVMLYSSEQTTWNLNFPPTQGHPPGPVSEAPEVVGPPPDREGWSTGLTTRTKSWRQFGSSNLTRQPGGRQVSISWTWKVRISRFLDTHREKNKTQGKFTQAAGRNPPPLKKNKEKTQIISYTP